MDDIVTTLKYGEAVVKIEDLVRARQITYDRGFNKGLVVGAITAVVVTKAWKYYNRNRTTLFGAKS